MREFLVRTVVANGGSRGGAGPPSAPPLILKPN